MVGLVVCWVAGRVEVCAVVADGRVEVCEVDDAGRLVVEVVVVVEFSRLVASVTHDCVLARNSPALRIGVFEA